MPDKIGRDAFLFMAPNKPDQDDDFAQCGPCRMFVPAKFLTDKSSSRCILHGSHVDVDDDDSCGLFAPWPTGEPNEDVIRDHAGELDKDIPGSVTPEESGLVSQRVQCHRCRFERFPICGLYDDLNRKFPEMFELDTAIETHSCCNAQKPKGKTRKSDSDDLRDVITKAVRGSRDES